MEFLTSLFSLSIPYTAKQSEKTVKKDIFKGAIHNFHSLLDPEIAFLVFSESLRSLVEGMCLPLLITYVITILNADESLYSLGQVMGSIAQVIMSLVYIYLFKKHTSTWIINMGALLMMISLLTLVFHLPPYLYLVAMIILGAGMAIRQLIGESVFISAYDESVIANKLSTFNSVVALFYLIGYIFSYFMPFIMSLKVIMGIGAVLIFLPSLLFAYSARCAPLARVFGTSIRKNEPPQSIKKSCWH